MAGDGTAAFRRSDPGSARTRGRPSHQRLLRATSTGRSREDAKGLDARRAHRSGAVRRSAKTRGPTSARRKLPVLFCSPTMELGVDIAELNVVNMRNVPPTPANYAQRSGRAGRSGQPALVFTYCSTGQPARPVLTSGARRTWSPGRWRRPKLDLAQRGPGPRARPRRSGWPRRAPASAVRSRTCSTSMARTHRSSCCRTSRRRPSRRPRSSTRVIGRRPSSPRSAPSLTAAPWFDDGWLETDDRRRRARARRRVRPLACAVPRRAGAARDAEQGHRGRIEGPEGEEARRSACDVRPSPSSSC